MIIITFFCVVFTNFWVVFTNFCVLTTKKQDEFHTKQLFWPFIFWVFLTFFWVVFTSFCVFFNFSRLRALELNYNKR